MELNFDPQFVRHHVRPGLQQLRLVAAGKRQRAQPGDGILLRQPHAQFFFHQLALGDVHADADHALRLALIIE